MVGGVTWILSTSGGCAGGEIGLQNLKVGHVMWESVWKRVNHDTGALTPCCRYSPGHNRSCPAGASRPAVSMQSCHVTPPRTHMLPRALKCPDVGQASPFFRVFLTPPPTHHLNSTIQKIPWLGLGHWLNQPWVQSLVGELRSCKATQHGQN